mgnify:CR=1 FL=1
MVTLVGHTGMNARYMGTYERSTERRVNGSPLFVKMLAGGGGYFLFRSSKLSGKWMVTNEESSGDGVRRAGSARPHRRLGPL